jgi:AhpC/TSA family
MTLALGDQLPSFDLPDTTGERHAAGDAAATVVVFTCNHCPYALAWHDRIADVARDEAGHGVRFLAINSNDAERYPRDSFAAMGERVAADPGAWPLPYLHDADQSVAHAFGAKTTPDVFVFDGSGSLVYRGAPDADWEDPSLDGAWLRSALGDVLAGRPVATPLTEPVGCSIKWRP